MLAIATFAQAGTAFLFLGVGALAGFVQEDYGLSAARTGLLVTAVGLTPLFTLIPTGRLLDRASERVVITGGALLLASGALAASASDSYVMLLVSLTLGGTGYSASQPGGSKVVAGWFDARQRGLAMGVRQTGLPLGGALAAAVLPAVAARSGWQVAMVIAGLVAAGSGVVFGLAYRRPPGLREPAAMRFRDQVRSLLRAPSMRTSMWAGLAMVASQFAIISSVMLFARDVHGIALATGAWLLVAAQVAGVAGRIALAAWSDHLRSRLVPVAISAVAAAACAIVLALVGSGVPLTVLLVVVSLMGFFSFGWYGPWVVFVAESAPATAVGLTLGIAMTANQLAIVVTPPLFGALVDRTDGYAASWIALAAVLGLAAVRVWRGRSAP